VPQRSNPARHFPGVGWDESGGWAVYCSCGWTSSPSPFLIDGADEFDDHMRVEGILIEEENDVGNV
jgi:hypothetical protein